MYNVSGLGQTIINDEGNGHYRFAVYRAMVPFDTIPIHIFNYSEGYDGGQRKVGDINADSIEEIALICNDSILGPAINIYTINASNVNDFNITPTKNEFLSCYPNPFNSSINITYVSSHNDKKMLLVNIYNILGEKIRTISASKSQESIMHIFWDTKGDDGNMVTSGIYFIKIIDNTEKATIKVLLLK